MLAIGAALKVAGSGLWTAAKGAPRWLWIAIATALILWRLWAWHVGTVTDAYAAGGKAAEERLAAKALKIKQQTDALTVKIAAALREKNNVEVRRIGAGADALRVRGPGKARSSCAVVPGGSGGPVAAGGSGDRPAARLSYPDGLIDLPFKWIVDTAEQCDLNRAEVLSWRDWYGQLREAWPKSEAAP